MKIRQKTRELLRSHWICLALITFIIVSCQSKQDSKYPAETVINKEPTFTVEPAPLRIYTRTPSVTKTPTPMYANFCKVSGSPDSFRPTAYPDYLINVDKAILSQKNQYTERIIHRSESYGASSYGSETDYIAQCHDEIPGHSSYRSYCSFEKKTSSIHVLTGELRGSPKPIRNESLLIGKEGWVKIEGGQWNQTWNLSEQEEESIVDEYKISPFFFKEMVECGIDNEIPGQEMYCFKINIPRLFMVMFDEEVTNVNCVNENKGILWVDPQTSLPSKLDLNINVAVTFSGQEDKEFPYNVKIDMSEIFKAFNQDFTYPNPK